MMSSRHTDEEAVVQVQEQRTGHDYYQRLLDATAEGICGLDAEGRIVFLNRAATQVLGVRPDALLGEAMHVLHDNPLDGRTYPQDECPICRACGAMPEGYVEHALFWRPNGTSFPVEYSWSPLREGETVSGAVITFADITERKIHAHEMLYILASAQCLLWYADVQFVSPVKPLRWFLWPPDEAAALRFLPIPIAEGQTFAQAFYECRLDEDKRRTDNYGAEQILAGRSSYRQEYRCRQADGQVRWICEVVQVEKVAEGRWRASGVCTDITELKRREAEIEVLNARLQRAITETHHRVKNNLQVIAAMIDLLTMDQPGMIPLEEFVRLSRHVRTLAAVHDILTQEAKAEGQSESASARTILEKLLGMIQETAGNRLLAFPD